MVALLLAAVIGGLIGNLIGRFLPDGAVKTLFETDKRIGFGPLTVDFFSISFTFGLWLQINFVSVLMIILVIIYFRWWYL